MSSTDTIYIVQVPMWKAKCERCDWTSAPHPTYSDAESILRQHRRILHVPEES